MSELDALRQFSKDVRSASQDVDGNLAVDTKAIASAIKTLDAATDDNEPLASVDIKPQPIVEPPQSTCPVCRAAFAPLVKIRDIAICGNCGSTVIVRSDGTLSVSRFSDLETLTVGEMAQLKGARGTVLRSQGRR